jgi:hypothetical protein
MSLLASRQTELDKSQQLFYTAWTDGKLNALWRWVFGIGGRCMRALAICGSPRANGNTQRLLEIMGEVLKEGGIDWELCLLQDKDIKSCIACRRCRETLDLSCSIKNDDFHPVFKKYWRRMPLSLDHPFILARPPLRPLACFTGPAMWQRQITMSSKAKSVHR